MELSLFEAVLAVNAEPGESAGAGEDRRRAPERAAQAGARQGGQRQGGAQESHAVSDNNVLIGARYDKILKLWLL